jgi:hypothetical protein
MRKSEYKWLKRGYGIIIGILFVLFGCHDSDVSSLQSEINLIAVRFVPDHRVGICNIKLFPGKKGTIIISGETTDLVAKNEIIKALNEHGKHIIDSIVLLPDTVKNNKFMGLVTLSVINLRREPKHASELVSQAILGTPVIILKRENFWLLIKTPDNYIAWTEESSVKEMDRSEMTVWRKLGRVIFLENTGWLYDTPSDKSGVVGDLVGGSIIEKTGESSEYIKLALPDGRQGFVKKQKIMDFGDWKRSISCTEEGICNVAATFMGLPYLWGGTSAKGVDCSGFVQSVFFRNGLILQRDASLQALHGKNIDLTQGLDKLKKGDLLFFGSKRNGTDHVTHVAIYTGNKEYINSSGRVMVNSLDSTQANFSSFKFNSLLSARRIVGVAGDPGIVPVNIHPLY